MDFNKLSNTDLDQVEHIVIKFEEQYAKFAADISGNTPLLIILKGHLYIENELKVILNKELANPYRIKNLTKFSDVMNFVFTIGALPTNLYAVINKINIIRNKFAHDVEYEFNELILKELEDCLNGELKKNYFNEIRQLDDAVDKLRVLLFWVWEYLISERLISKYIAEKLKYIK